MITIKELLNKICYDSREKPEDYVFYYFDRVENKLKELRYDEIKRIEGNFVVVERDGKEVEIPLHRVREVRKKGKVVWKR